ncbi:GTP-binding protein [Collinsella sp. zg1085]|uniref:GTP-binding protein n=1 Tax=Collinsella sp. zg1085 TaxID=2844380 RepID=UPI001C0E0AFE|nr:GTP-binding protein [Collinsella sp. zg1085]QWT17347.1 GTP-binding protein [Collinsella sp. zg1085]
MRILVVSGFLGAGKTTFIQELARKSGKDFVVYENEFGQADIDAQVLAQTDELSVWESTENCICCTGKQDFATSILTISNTLDPEYLVVEPTGVARLSSVLENVDQVAYERISLLAPLAIVDATAWVRQRERFRDIYLDQVATARTVVVSKSQLAGEGELEEVISWISSVNANAEIEARPWDQLDGAWFSKLLLQDLDPDAAPVAQAAAPAEDEFESISLKGVQMPTESHMIWFLDALSAGTFGEIVRAKGMLPCGNQWLRFDMVDRMWSLTGMDLPASEDEAVAVFIGPDVRRPWLREMLVPLIRDATSAARVEAALDESFDVVGHTHAHGEEGHVCDEHCEHHHTHEHEQVHEHEHHHEHEHEHEHEHQHEHAHGAEQSVDAE